MALPEPTLIVQNTHKDEHILTDLFSIETPDDKE